MYLWQQYKEEMLDFVRRTMESSEECWECVPRDYMFLGVLWWSNHLLPNLGKTSTEEI